ncbi:MAG: 3-deoxy-manno-octulosonate cytidylyltransferase [bacterium]|jgi:3-deoxy-manno-octulosonate cytidylyltransferase (CMP-KDO synthetase)
MKVLGVIPARYGSTRFPAKVLAPILGRPMIEWVWRGASGAALIDELVVATDDERVAECVRGFGGRVEMTRADHASGTDRIGEVAERCECDYIVNIQGDEPTIKSADLDEMIGVVLDEGAEMGTLASECNDIEYIREPSTVKVVVDRAGYALYFSRFPIPYPRNVEHASYLVHGGVYIYRRDVLFRLCRLAQTPLELAESLEQLRAMENGIRIRVVTTGYTRIAVDVPGDVARVEAALRQMN